MITNIFIDLSKPRIYTHAVKIKFYKYIDKLNILYFYHKQMNPTIKKQKN